MSSAFKVGIAVLGVAVAWVALGIVAEKLKIPNRSAVVLILLVNLLWSLALVRWALNGPYWAVVLLFVVTGCNVPSTVTKYRTWG